MPPIGVTVSVNILIEINLHVLLCGQKRFKKCLKYVNYYLLNNDVIANVIVYLFKKISH
jgi:hypothetical protein